MCFVMPDKKKALIFQPAAESGLQRSYDKFSGKQKLINRLTHM